MGRWVVRTDHTAACGVPAVPPAATPVEYNIILKQLSKFKQVPETRRRSANLTEDGALFPFN